MTYIAACLVCVLAIELFLLLPVLEHTKTLAAVSQKIIHVISSAHISDHWKERVLLRYALDMARASLLIWVFLLIIVAAVVALAYMLDRLFSVDPPSLEFLSSWAGLGSATLFSLGYIYLRKRLVPA